MVEVDNTNVWSRYAAVHEFCQQPMHALINIVGGTEELRSELDEIIINGLLTEIHRPGI